MSAMGADSGIKQGEVVPRRSDAEWADVIRADLARSVQGIIDAGRHLVQAKEQVGHGNWSEWLLRELRMDYRTAQRFMAIGRNPVLSNATHVSHLPASWGTLYVLSRAPETRLVKAIEAGIVTRKMERKDAERWVEAERVRGLGLTGGGSGRGGGGKTAEPPVPAGEPVIDRTPAEDSSPGKADRPDNTVLQTVKTGTTGTVTTTTETGTTTAGPAENVTVKPPAGPGTPGPQPCPGCRNLEAKLAAAEERIGKLKAAQPDVVLTAERDAIAADRDRLAARVAELEAQLSAASGGSGETGPGDGTGTVASAADSALSELGSQPERGGPCQHPSGCGNRGFPARAERVDGSGKSWTGLLCGDCYGREEAKGSDLAWSRPAEKVSA